MEHKKMRLGVFVQTPGHHVGGWRHPDATVDGWPNLALMQHIAATAERDGGAVVGGLARAHVEEGVAMRARHLGTLLGRRAVRPVRDEDEMTVLPIDPDEGGAAALGREIPFRDARTAPLLPDQANKGGRDQESAADAHTHSPRRPAPMSDPAASDVGPRGRSTDHLKVWQPPERDAETTSFVLRQEAGAS
mgnify:CR=1 FL=1